MSATINNAKNARQYTVFVSHASADNKSAEEFVEAIERKGLTAWIAPRDIAPGREYAEEIIKGIDQSKCFVLLVSEASNLSSHVRREVERAASKSKPIYPVRIEDVPPSPKLEYFISMHQSLDALDGVLATHAERIATAIASDEEWVGNRVLTRRRRWRIGAVLSSVLLAVAIFVSVVFAPDMRTLFMNERERAAAELAKRGSSLTSEDVARAMASANVVDLDLFLEAGIGVGALTDGFIQAGRSFFERSQGNQEAIHWLNDAIAAGVDPNLTVESEHYGREGLISSAFGSGNIAAILTLLEAGASPHTYQDLHLSPYAIPRILFPYTYALSNDHWSEDQQAEVVRGLADAGAALVPPEEDAFSFEYHHIEQYKHLVEASERLNVSSAILPAGCAARSSTSICEKATAATNKDWCALAEKMPEYIVPGDSYDHRMTGFTIHQLLTVSQGKGYFLTTTPQGWDGGYALLEVAANEQDWSIYRYMSPGAGLGHCKPFIDQEDYRPDDCWRRFSMRWEPDRSVVRLSDYYDYPALACSQSSTSDG